MDEKTKTFQILIHEIDLLDTLMYIMDVLRTAIKIIEKLQSNGAIAYIAGGAVRDMLMGHAPNDIDIVTSMSLEAMRPLFKKTLEVGAQFGILIVIEEGHKFEIATFRTESEYKDGRRPEIILPADPHEDAKRRDFTINGMFFDPINNQTIDFVGGKEDLREKMIRAIGNPHDRFGEDRLRMIRAIRYAARFDFSIDPTTQEAICAHAHTLLPAVSFERVLQEMQKMHADKTLFHCLLEMQRLNLLPTLFPPLKGVSIDSLQQTRLPSQAPVILQLKAFLNHIVDQERFEWIKRLKFSQKELALLEFSDLLEKRMESDPIEKRVHLYASPHFLSAMQLLPDPLQERALYEMQTYKNAIERVAQKKPIVTANDLLELGIEKGPQMGEYLKKAEAISITHQIEDKAAILKRLFS